MADLAEIGFKVDTKELADAKIKLDQLTPAAAKSERAALALAKATGSLSTASMKAARAELEHANAAYKAAQALGKTNSAAITATGAAQKAAQAAYNDAKAANAATQANLALAAAKMKLAAATKQANVAQSQQTIAQPRLQAANGNDPIAPINRSLGAMKANVGNIAAQFQDVGVTAAMGMNPLLIALQQGTQLSAIFAGMRPGEAVAALGTAFRSVIGVTAIATLGFVAVAAAIIQFIDWIAVAKYGLNALANGLVMIAPYALAAGTALAIAFAPQIAVAIWSITSAIVGGLITAIGSLAIGIVALVGAIPVLIAAVIAGIFYFSDEIKQVFGVDVIAYTKLAVNYIIGAFVGAFHDIQFLWNQFPDIIGAAAIGAANYVISAINDIIKASVQGYNQLVMTANAVITKFGAEPIPLSDAKLQGFDLIANDAATRLSGAVKDRNSQLKKDLETDYLGAIGGAITSAATKAADKIRSFASGLGVSATDGASGKAPKTPKGPKSEGEKFSDIVAGAERTIATLEAQKAAIGQTAEETARLKYETQLLNEAQQKNINLTPDQKNKLIDLASAMSKLEVETARAKEALDFSKSTFKGFISDIAQGLESGKSFWESFADAGLNALNKLVDKLLNDVIDALFQVNSAASGGGSGGGWLGSLVSGAGSFIASLLGVPTFAKGSAFANGINGHSNSVVSSPTMFAFASGAGLMGEAGPEAIMPLTRMPNGDLGVQANSNQPVAANNNSGPVQVTLTINVEGARGNQEVMEMVNNGVASGLQMFNNNVLPGRVVQINSDTRVR